MQWGYIESLGMLAFEEIRLPMGGSGLGFLGPESTLGVSRRDIQKKLNRRLANQHWARWRSLGDTQRQARGINFWAWSGCKGQSYVL